MKAFWKQISTLRDKPYEIHRTISCTRENYIPNLYL